MKMLTKKISEKMPWWVKISAKIILSRIPFVYEKLRNISMFCLGEMKHPEYAYFVFKKHFECVQPEKGFVFLELGPGDSLFNALIGKAFGAERMYFIDVSDFAVQEMKYYNQMCDFLKDMKKKIECNFDTLEGMLQAYHAEYYTKGIVSLENIPDKSVDFIFSQAVLEHVRKKELTKLFRQMRRVIKDEGAATCVIDFKDHVGGGLNNLRFSEKVWESDFMAKSGFYTNRIRFTEMVELAKENGFNITVVEKKMWDKIPVSRSFLSKKFKNLTDNDLKISEAMLLLKTV